MATKSEGVGLIVRAISFQDFQPTRGVQKVLQLDHKEEWKCYRLYFIFQYIPTEFNAFATFFWQTVNSTKIEIYCLSLQPLIDSFIERFIVMRADRRSESSANLHDNLKINTLL